jgi:hypothetical protein
VAQPWTWPVDLAAAQPWTWPVDLAGGPGRWTWPWPSRGPGRGPGRGFPETPYSGAAERYTPASGGWEHPPFGCGALPPSGEGVAGGPPRRRGRGRGTSRRPPPPPEYQDHPANRGLKVFSNRSPKVFSKRPSKVFCRNGLPKFFANRASLSFFSAGASIARINIGRGGGFLPDLFSGARILPRTLYTCARVLADDP